MKELYRKAILNALLLALAFTLAANTGLHAQSKFTTAQLANLQPLDPSAVPPFGTFWLLKSPDPDHGYPPLPCPPGDMPGLPIYALGDGHYLVDDSQVDYTALRQQQEANQALSNLEVQYGLRASPDGGGPLGPTPMDYTADDLWLQLITLTNATGFFVVHPPAAEAMNGVYDLYMTTNLSPSVPGLNLTNWMWLLRTDPGQTNLIVPELYPDMAFFMLGRTNDADGDGMPDAYEHLVTHTDPNHPDAPIIVVQPFSQEVDQGDTVTFSVVAEGAQPLSYHWFLGGNAVTGETNSFLTLPSADPSQQGDYSVQVTSPVGLSVLSSNATLTVDPANNWPLVTLTGPRYNYTFKNGITYYVSSRVELYGVTTIEGGAIIKADWYYTNSTLAVMGTLALKTDDQYFPAFFTSVDDDTLGDSFSFSSGSPATANNGAPYLDLTYSQDPQPALSNLRIRYADQGIALPASTHVDVWDCQFLRCNVAVVAEQGAVAAFHNSLFSACGAVASGLTNFSAVTAEHITADVTNFWVASGPSRIALTNSIVVGSIASGPTLVTDHSSINAGQSVFQSAGSGHYYLTNSSPYRGAGTPNISPRIATDLSRKSTQPPVVLPDMIQLSGNLTFGQQVARYTNGAPDYGFYYPALDYTVGWITNRGTITILPGTAIGFRNEHSSTHGRYTWWGFDLREGSSFISHGTATRPNTFADVQMVQEQLTSACIAMFVPDFWPNDDSQNGLSLDLRFCNFYANSHWYHVWSGFDASYQYLFSPDSLVNWTMRDCNLHGGRITIGEPDDGSWYGAPSDWVYGECSVSWKNNLFDNVSIDLDPTLYEYGSDDQGLNVDMAFEAYNNLFRGGMWLHLEPIPASAGDWVWRDNLFDKVDFVQDTSEPVDNNYNGYWPLTSSELSWLYNYYPWFQANSGQFLASTNSGGNEQVLTAAPPYQTGPLGDYYLPTTTPLYHAGSRTAGDAALFHYTTRVDQIKDGDEFSGHMVNIGLHYVATSGGTSSQPKDSDHDGIPDYVENASGTGTVGANETDWQNAYSTAGIYDPTNAVYDNTDLSGNGLVGRIKKALGVNPLSTSNPLRLTQVITGEEPDFATFSVPVSYDTVTNLGTLQLRVDGVSATLQDIARASNGSCLLIWNTTYESPGQRYLQPEMRFDGETDENTVMSGIGSVGVFNSGNMVQFFEATSAFTDSGTTLYAQTPSCPDASYIVELKSPTGEHIRSFTNTTHNGVISEVWDGTYEDGVTPYTGDVVDAVYNVTLLDPGNGTNTQRLNKTYGVVEGNFDVAYAYNPSSELQKDGSWWNQMTAVVDKLLAPRNGYDAIYNSTFDWYWEAFNPGYPGYLPDRPKALSLLTNLAAADTKNFYFYGHGSSSSIGDGTSNANRPYLSVWEVGKMLTNSWSSKGIVAKHPYRFVFLDGCETASSANWPHAFGMYDPGPPGLPQTSIGRQAFLGWDATVGGIRDSNNVVLADLANAYGTTMNLFYSFWMSKAQVWACVSAASSKNLAMPLPVKGNENFTVNNRRWTRATANLKLVGYRDLNRSN
jgi:hypothetical protein